MSHERCKCCQEIHEVIHGKPTDPRTGLFHIATGTADSVFGTDHEPGLLKRTTELEKHRENVLRKFAFAMGAWTIINGLLVFFGPTILKKITGP